MFHKLCLLHPISPIFQYAGTTIKRCFLWTQSTAGDVCINIVWRFCWSVDRWINFLWSLTTTSSLHEPGMVLDAVRWLIWFFLLFSARSFILRQAHLAISLACLFCVRNYNNERSKVIILTTILHIIKVLITMFVEIPENHFAEQYFLKSVVLKLFLGCGPSFGHDDGSLKIRQ